eukprot:Hpha_TRINITY_DN15989_c0_g2::TRINITY_DN15989_c0_g2_i1::g.72379::m.72379/K10408/DNAH; dynein heavy chain, axonemal
MAAAGRQSLMEDLAKDQPDAQDSEESDDDDLSAGAENLCVQWIQTRALRMLCLQEGAWDSPNDDNIVDRFLSEPLERVRTLYGVAGEDGSLFLSTTPPSHAPRHAPGKGDELVAVQDACCYFVRIADDTITEDNIQDVVHFGVLHGNGVDAFLRTMQFVLSPSLLHNKSWPESIQKEFSTQMHKFLAGVTENANRIKGSTVLYVPLEHITEVEKSAGNKELVQRFEAALIHWTRQIKDVLSEKDQVESSGESEGPLAEIHFWNLRAQDLNNILQQLERQDVKQIVEILRLAKSVYLEPFEKLAGLIREGTQEAKDNLRYLRTLQDPCMALREARAKDIPNLLQPILETIQMIFLTSECYNTPERLVGILKKVSNEIIARCRAEIDLEAIFQSHTTPGSEAARERAKQALQDATAAGRAWTTVCKRMLDATEKRYKTEHPTTAWESDTTNQIFAEMEQFMDVRCANLLEVCEGQQQFGMKPAEEMPCFSGVRGPEVLKSLNDIQRAFERNISQLRNLTYPLLDVKQTKWRDDYARFKEGVKNLETQLTNIISGSFDIIPTLESGVEFLEAFAFLAERETVKRAVWKKTDGIFQLFNKELAQIKAWFNEQKKDPPCLQAHPPYVGRAIWGNNLKTRIDTHFKLLSTCHYLPSKGTGGNKDEALMVAQTLSSNLEQYIQQQYNDWKEGVEQQEVMLHQYLDIALIHKVHQHDAGIMVFECNFSPELLTLLDECRYWMRSPPAGLGMNIPPAAQAIQAKEERLRVFRENVCVAVSKYNQIVRSLSPEERGLFEERVAALDVKYNPGMTKMLWSSKGIVEYFVRECTKCSNEVQENVDHYKESVRKIHEYCKRIATTLLVKIERKHTYRMDEFESVQRKHREEVRDTLRNLHGSIVQKMKYIFSILKKDYQQSEDIRREWSHFVEKIEKDIDDALRQTVKRSLQEISKAIVGDAKTGEPGQLFQVSVVLEGSRPELQPTVLQLSQMINHVSKELITVISVVKRLEEELQEAINDALGDEAEADTGGAQDSFYEVISHDNEILKVMVAIMTGMSTIQEDVTKYLFLRWEKYNQVHTLDKDAYTRRFAKGKREMWQFDQEIQKYKDQMSLIQNEETKTTIKFIKVECLPLKGALNKHCNEWMGKFYALLNQMASQELNSMYDMFKAYKKKIQETPVNLDMLGEQLATVQKLKTDEAATEARFKPVKEQYALLEKYEVAFSDQEADKLSQLDDAWEAFKKSVHDARKKLEKEKEKFRMELEADIQVFTKHSGALFGEFLEKGPYDGEMTPAEAFKCLNEYKQKLQQKRDKESQLRQGMEIFKIEKPAYADLKKLQDELDLLSTVWKLTEDWQTFWESLKVDQFQKLNLDDIGDELTKYNKQCNALRKQLDKRTVWINLRAEIERFRRTVPLLTHLRNDAMRARHWDQLMDEIGDKFDPWSPDFTLTKVDSLNLSRCPEFIENLSNSASQEMLIEKGLQKVKTAWETQCFMIESYHKDYFKISSVDEISQVLEDHLSSLSNMKVSRYVQAFASEVQHWEATLSVISDTIEALLSVQTKWMYLENIFIGSEEIQKKLPSEAAMFATINSQWNTIMVRLHQDPNVCRGTTKRDGLLDQLNMMIKNLEKIQKNLENYLEDRRRVFPRFYFLADDDLLEILGHSREPRKVLPHLKKCFEGIHMLEFGEATRKGGGTVAKSMSDASKEVVDFHDPKPQIEGIPVENWLGSVEAGMRSTLKKRLWDTFQNLRAKPKELGPWLFEHKGQMLITSASLNWTTEVEKVLKDLMAGTSRKKNPVRSHYKRWKMILNKYTELVRGKLSRLDRNKLVSLVTIEVHHRDLLDSLQSKKVGSIYDFAWTSQLRFYWMQNDAGENVVQIRMASAFVNYDYEYQGNNGRLVVTGLTDRCYMTLTTALQLNRGGLPQGPAGTGKTETVKDLSKAVAKYVLVFNCSDGLDFQSMGGFFSGLAQCGAWSCFDEFNRIEVEVLSVVAQQMLAILNAVREKKREFTFEGSNIPLNLNVGIFVTMNPAGKGYAGRSELPDNLKALLRPVSMMTPDFAMICEITLLSQGFQDSKVLGYKVTLLYELMDKQLSKQNHYDCSLRNIKAVLVQAGKLKRDALQSSSDTSEDQLCLKACSDMNLPKFVKDDVPLFLGMLQDLFPGVEAEGVGLEELQEEALNSIRDAKLQTGPNGNLHVIGKIYHLYDTMNTRHSVIVDGESGSGKTVVWKTMADAFRRLKERGLEGWEPVKVNLLNPKAVTMDELYGSYNLATREWKDGIVSSIMKQICSEDTRTKKWLMFDGPVDTKWIESMNTVMDDNKMLTLINGDRISLTPEVSVVFECDNLLNASPATVSRCGIVFFNYVDLTWEPYYKTWLNERKEYEVQINAPKPEQTVKIIAEMFETHLQKALDFKARELQELFPVPEIGIVRSLTYIFDAIASPEAGLDVKGGGGDPASVLETYQKDIQLFWTFAFVWSVGGPLKDESRVKFDSGYARDVSTSYPTSNTVYEYFVDPKQHCWKAWDEKVPATFSVPRDTPYYKMVVPTVDTARYCFILRELVRCKRHVLMTGNTGTGKTIIAREMLDNLPNDRYAQMMMNFSAQTSSQNVQDIVEGKMEKKSKKNYTAPGGKRLICLIEDLNMPSRDSFGSQPPLELLRMWMENNYWYDRSTQSRRAINDLQLLCNQTFGRPEITPRMMARLVVMNVTFPHPAVIEKIFRSILAIKLSDDDVFSAAIEDLVKGTFDVFKVVTTDPQTRPIPSKSHYLFSLRDLSKVFQGIMQADHEFLQTKHDKKEGLIVLWLHECLRIFSDRMNTHADKNWFRELLTSKLESLFGVKWKTVVKHGGNPIFVDFYEGDYDEMAKYKEVEDLIELKTKLDGRLLEHNEEPGSRPMQLVFFMDAVEHLCRINRIIRQPRGNALLVGVGGSGRTSMTRIASYLAGYKTFQIEITKQYRSIEFHDDLKKLYQSCGSKKQNRVFIFADTQIAEASFLEDINNMLSSGEVPNLFAQDDKAIIKDECRKDAMEAGCMDNLDQIFQFFIDRARSLLHLVVCLSPVGEEFRVRIRMFPSLVSCTTIDWFMDWPDDALREVARNFVHGINLGGEGTERLESVAEGFVTMHSSVGEQSRKMAKDLKRYNYVTPTNYLELVRGYVSLLAAKRSELGEQRDKLKNGMAKLNDTEEKVEKMQEELQKANQELAKKEKEVDATISMVQKESKQAEERKLQVDHEKARIEKEKDQTNAIAAEAQADLAEALPALNAAEEALKTLRKEDIQEMKAYKAPPEAVQTTMAAVQTVLRRGTSWDECKKTMGDSKFLDTLVQFDKEGLTDRLLSAIAKFTGKDSFKPELIGKVSAAAKGLCQWVIAMEKFGKINKEVAPKKRRLEKAQEDLNKKEKMLAEALAQLHAMEATVQKLKDQAAHSEAEKETLKREAEKTAAKLQRAEELVSGLGSERDRWTTSIARYELGIENLIGDVLLASGMLSYIGPFTGEFRDTLSQQWRKGIKGLPLSKNFAFVDFYSEPTEVRQWQLDGLPGDDFSVMNGVLIMRGARWPLMVDPQGQGNKWIKNMERARGLKVIDLKQADFLRTIEHAVQFGAPVLLQDVQQSLDPSLDSILSKQIMRQGTRLVIKIGDNTVDYNDKFKLYITTKLASPHYTPETCTKVTLVNCAVKDKGLEEQLLKVVVAREQKELEEQNDQLVISTAENKRKEKELEDKILRLLSEADDSLLDDQSLIDTLKTSKKTGIEIAQKLKEGEVTAAKIQETREQYRECAQRASILYFVLSDLCFIDTMYQFALDAYIILFIKSIKGSSEVHGSHGRSEPIANRVKVLNSWHTSCVYDNTCRGLFERHKLLFSFHMTASILLKKSGSEKDFPVEEYAFMIKGGQVMDKESRPPNPASDWLEEKAWDNLIELDKLTAFHGIAGSVEQSPSDWKRWFMHPLADDDRQPEDNQSEWQAPVGEWLGSSSPKTLLQKMLLVRCMRPDRVVPMVRVFIEENLGSKFVEPPGFSLGDVFRDSSAVLPLVFVLSPGVDPMDQLRQLSEQQGRVLKSLALGQGQAPAAQRMIHEQARQGGWVFLQNCHLMLKWLPHLEKVIDDLPAEKPNENFRLWLSSIPHPQFPIGILQKAIKMTTEPPTGIKANLSRLYSLITEEQFNKAVYRNYYRPLLFSLCFFHSVLLERKKFGSLGYNMEPPYDFNDADFSISEAIISVYINEMDDPTPQSIPLQTIRYLVCDASYGGRVTDDWDRRTLQTYATQYLCLDAVMPQPQYQLSQCSEYIIPSVDGTLTSYRDYVKSLPVEDSPYAFGQHPNADIMSQIIRCTDLLDCLMTLNATLLVQAAAATSSKGAGAAMTAEQMVLGTIDQLEGPSGIPEDIDYLAVVEAKVEELEAKDALTTCLLQEIQRYNILLTQVKGHLAELRKGVSGMIIMNDILDGINTALLFNKVPDKWEKHFPTMKPLSSWVEELRMRIDQMNSWGRGSTPKLFWMGGFTYPTGFLKALQQSHARKAGISIDQLGWEFTVLDQETTTITQSAREGAYVKGIFLEGAGWDGNALCEPEPMALVKMMPFIHFRPVIEKKQKTKGKYNCPLYLYPTRTGSRERPSFVVTVILPSGSHEGDHWVKRGTALLLATAS